MDSFSGITPEMRGVLPTERERALAMVQKLPASVRVGVYGFEIEKWHALRAAGTQRWGECSIMEMRISIQLDMPTRLKAADTFMHEVQHAIWWAYGVLDEAKEERTVNILATGWLAVYRDNPWLLDWLKEAVS